MNSDIASFFHDVSVWALPVVLAITLHEAAHGLVAWLLGDPTAKAAGRLSLNPIRHIDPFGTVILPGLLLAFTGFAFGYARPVPVDYRNLRKPRRDSGLIAAAGPLANFLMALIGALALALMIRFADDSRLTQWLGQNFLHFVVINVLLGTFNLLPLPPLDGGRVLIGLLPRHLALRFARIEPYGMAILFLLVFVVPFVSSQFGHPINPLGRVLIPLVNLILNAIMNLMGQG